MQNKILPFVYEEQGATSVEYAIMVSLIAVVIIVAVTALGLATHSLFNNSATRFPEVP